MTRGGKGYMKISVELFDKIQFIELCTHTRKITTPDIHSRAIGTVTLPFWLDMAFAVPKPSGIEKKMRR